MATVAQYAASALGISPAAAAAIGIFGGAIPGVIQAGYTKRIERRIGRAAAGIAAAADPNLNPGDIPVNERSEESFVSMWVEMMSAVDDAAAAPLGHLAMTYARWDIAPDRFFRSFGSVVRELDARGLVELRALLAECVRRIDAHEATSADAIVVRTSLRDPRGRSLESRRPGEDGWWEIAQVENGIRLLSLLKQHDLATQAADVPGPVGFDPEIALLWRGLAGRALTHLDMTPPENPRVTP